MATKGKLLEVVGHKLVPLNFVDRTLLYSISSPGPPDLDAQLAHPRSPPVEWWLSRGNGVIIKKPYIRHIACDDTFSELSVGNNEYH